MGVTQAVTLTSEFLCLRWTSFFWWRILACACTVAGFTQSAQISAPPPTHVHLQNNVVIPSSQGAMHSVSFRYSFPGRDSIRISGFGMMPPSGELSYLTPDTQIEFSDPAGSLIEAVDLKDAAQLMGAGATDTPARSEFPDNFRLGFWKQKTSFSVHAMKVLNQQFTSGLLPTITEANGENVLITAYQSLSGLPQDLFGEVAVLVTHADKSLNEELTFRVRWSVREKRKLTRWRTPVSEATKQAAEAFVTKLLATLQMESEEKR